MNKKTKTAECKHCKKVILKTYYLEIEMNPTLTKEWDKANIKIKHICNECYRIKKLKE